jgi:G3E family GTPase
MPENDHALTPQQQDALVPIPLTVLTGFLGAGKTTRLNQWLKNPAFADTLVIINEFGEIGLDHLLIEEVSGDMMLMAAGCLCCTIRGDLVATLEDLLRRRDNDRIRFFRRVVIETTGLADPLPVLHAVLQHPYLSKRFAISGVLCIVDAVNGAATLDNHAEARRQVAIADGLILSKGDIATRAETRATEAAVSAINPFAQRLGPLALAAPDSLTAQRFSPTRLDEPTFLAWLGANTPVAHAAGHDATRHGSDIEAFSFMHAEPVSEAQVLVFREAMRILHGPKLLRLKGLINVKESPDQPVVIHHVQSVAHHPVKLPHWPTRDRRTRLVFITQGVERAVIEGFWQALVKST